MSLFGYDFDKDHTQITKDDQGDEGGVRVSLEDPAQSLLLKKGAALISHKGKERFAKNSWEYNLLLKWIRGGAKIDVTETGEFERLEVFPKEIAFQKEGESIQLKVLAHWKDGTVEDITEITRFRSNDDAVAAVSETGRVLSKGKGDSHVVAFYDNGVLPVPVMLAISDVSKYPKNIAAPTKVDEWVNAKLRKAGIVPAGVCTDAEFLRRASLDVTGTLPTPVEIEAFLADARTDKRRLKIEELLGRPGYAAWWTTKLCDFTGNNPVLLRGNNLIANGGQYNFGPQLARQWFDWIYARVDQNKPYDELATGIVLGAMRSRPDQPYEEYVREMAGYFRTGDPADFGARETMPWFWARQNVAKAEDKALAFAHTFLGVRIECAQCHKHPFDQWTKQDFAQFQAFFTTIGFRQGEGKKGVVAPVKTETSGMTYEVIREEIRREAKEKVDAEYLAKDLKRAKEAREAQLKEDALKQAQTDSVTVAQTPAPQVPSNTSPSPDGSSLGPGAASEAVPGGIAPSASAQTAAVAAVAAEKPEKPLEPLPLTDGEKSRREADLKVAYQRATELILSERIKKGQPLPWADLTAQTPQSPKPSKNPAASAAVSGGNRVMTPKLLGGEQVMLETFADVRKPLMEWLRAQDNPYFARAWVNRVWANYFGRGIVEPADDLNLANAPSNAELFDYLSKGFASHGFDMKWLHREILTSDAYQRSWKTNNTNKLDEKNFSHAMIRRLPAELVHDAIMMATDTQERLAQYAVNVHERAIGAAGTTNYIATMKGGKGAGADSYALNIFGKPARQTNCDCERVTDPTLLQTIYTRNDPSLLARIDSKRGTAWIESVLGIVTQGKAATPATPPDPAKVEQLIREIYLRTLSRPPSVEETAMARGDILANPSSVDGSRELLWTLLNTREFLVNH
ncbi:MAG: Protein of unknown function (DUF1553)/Protein of unknown function (DUF1549) [Verrucomicrobia bacterium]|nr:MAG: Protein of unknown function (DUF1553)/Protein of unknown function (DUF1549) [Verrucomicrobiota bacterium]